MVARTLKLWIKRTVPPGLWERMRAWHYRPHPKVIRWGRMRRLTPVARDWHERGNPVDRYYIEAFLDKYRADIRGVVMEVADSRYTRMFGGDQVTRSEVLHVVAGNPDATFVGNLETGVGVPQNAFDCMIVTQVLLCIYDVREAIANAYCALKPGGVLLCTVPGICRICRPDIDLWGDYWRFTTRSAQRLFEEVFGKENVTVECYGNVLTAMGFFHNLGADEFRKEELNYHDPDYQILISVRAVKPR
ncbi:MAG TPA: methyltransferase domain-containing protein [Chthonomonadaceae bacterium]|nr:methyltransferase domain-containing protein [Chthonomonadaceae bacterium]